MDCANLARSPLPEPSPEACAGTTYELKADDDCHSVSLSRKISTAWLLSDNQLDSWCNGFPTSGSLCLINTCEVVTVESGDTCRSIARSANITEVQLKTWNPVRFVSPMMVSSNF